MAELKHHPEVQAFLGRLLDGAPELLLWFADVVDAESDDALEELMFELAQGLECLIYLELDGGPYDIPLTASFATLEWGLAQSVDSPLPTLIQAHFAAWMAKSGKPEIVYQAISRRSGERFMAAILSRNNDSSSDVPSHGSSKDEPFFQQHLAYAKHFLEDSEVPDSGPDRSDDTAKSWEDILRCETVTVENFSFSLHCSMDRYFLSAVCGSVGIYETVLELNPQEVANYRENGLDSIRELAQKVSDSPSSFASRKQDLPGSLGQKHSAEQIRGWLCARSFDLRDDAIPEVFPIFWTQSRSGREWNQTWLYVELDDMCIWNLADRIHCAEHWIWRERQRDGGAKAKFVPSQLLCVVASVPATNDEERQWVANYPITSWIHGGNRRLFVLDHLSRQLVQQRPPSLTRGDPFRTDGTWQLSQMLERLLSPERTT